jgi:hypothetical protein
LPQAPKVVWNSLLAGHSNPRHSLLDFADQHSPCPFGPWRVHPDSNPQRIISRTEGGAFVVDAKPPMHTPKTMGVATRGSGRLTGKPEITTWLLPSRRLSLANNMSGVFSK